MSRSTYVKEDDWIVGPAGGYKRPKRKNEGDIWFLTDQERKDHSLAQALQEREDKKRRKRGVIVSDSDEDEEDEEDRDFINDGEDEEEEVPGTDDEEEPEVKEIRRSSPPPAPAPALPPPVLLELNEGSEEFTSIPLPPTTAFPGYTRPYLRPPPDDRVVVPVPSSLLRRATPVERKSIPIPTPTPSPSPSPSPSPQPTIDLTRTDAPPSGPDALTCKICLQAVPHLFAFLPCGHACVCQTCKDSPHFKSQRKTCIVCRTKSTRLLRIFM